MLSRESWLAAAKAARAAIPVLLAKGYVGEAALLLRKALEFERRAGLLTIT